MEYAKTWLPLSQQVDRLTGRGLAVDDRERALHLLQSIGYYRLTGYLYAFLEGEEYTDDDGRTRSRVLNRYLPGTALHHAEAIIDFDRRLRMLVLEGIERIEVAVRMQVGYVLGRSSAFAYEDPANSTTHSRRRARTAAIRSPARTCSGYSASRTGGTGPMSSSSPTSARNTTTACRSGPSPSFSSSGSCRACTGECSSRTPRSSLSRSASRGRSSWPAGSPASTTCATWRLITRGCSTGSFRTRRRDLLQGWVPLLDHLRAPEAPKKDFGTYNALAVIAYLLLTIAPESEWPGRLVELFDAFPTSHALTIGSIGVPDGWESLDLWRCTRYR